MAIRDIKNCRILCIVICFFLYTPLLKSEIVINEIQTSNLTTLHDEYYKYNDWVELYNSGPIAVNLNGYCLSDDSTKINKFRFPDYTLPVGGYVVIFAGDTTKTVIKTHWETAVKASDIWKYRANATSPGSINWRDLNFADASWLSGTGGIGFGDNDDGTTVSTCISIYMRKVFNIPDTSKIQEAIFNMDYDDGFIAYLNGVEIARSNIGTPGTIAAWNQIAPAAWEATLYQNQYPDSFHLDKNLLRSLLLPGTNVLAVETHNQTSNNTDLSSNPFLTFSVNDGSTFFGNPPSWFHYATTNYFHADFKLSKKGETIYLSNSNGIIVDTKKTVILETDNSLARNPDGSNSWCLIQNPTPAASNNLSDCKIGYATPPIFSLSSGFYTTSKQLILSTTFSGGLIRYTKDGSDVTEASTLYSTPITISSTQTIKARVFSADALPSQTVTQTYLLNFDCKLPVFCLTTDPKNLYDNNTGIFVDGPDAQSAMPHFGANYWKDFEKPVSVEYFERNKALTFQFNSAMAITGGWSRTHAQKSLEIKLGDKYGLSNLNYSLESSKPWLDKWDNFILHDMGNDNDKCRMRDPLMERILQATHCDHVSYEPCLVILNGQNWGLYYTRENDDHHWIESNYGYKSDNVDLLKESYFHPGIEVKKGNDSAFFSMYNYSTQTSPTDPSYYSTINSLMDLENMADYFIAETYYPNDDWMGGSNNNLKLWRPRNKDGKFHYLIYDLDFGLGLSGSASLNMLGTALAASPHNYNSELFAKFTQNPVFKNYFINRYADLINTIFLPSNIQDMAYMFRDSLRHDIHFQNEKWGGPDSTAWKTNIATMLTFANQRPANARNIIQSEFGLTSQVTLTLQVSPAGAGRIEISTISPDTYPWNGVYFNGNPVTLTAIPNPGYSFDHWKSNSVISSNNINQSVTYNFNTNDVITCYFTGSAQTIHLNFSELNYNSASNNNPGDWIELYNSGTTALNISNWILRDEADNHTFTFPVSTSIPANGYLVVASDLEKFHTVFPTVNNVVGGFGFDFSNGSEVIRLFDYTNTLFSAMTYADYQPWPIQADGQGYTLERLNYSQSTDDGSNWFAGCLLGSPGKAYSPPTVNVTAQGGTTYCIGSTASLHATTQPGATYQWLMNNTNIIGQTNADLLSTQDGDYSVRISLNGCSINSDTTTLHFIPVGSVFTTTSSERCEQGEVTLSASGTSLLNWFESDSSGNVLQAGNTFTTPLLTQTTTYYVSASGICPGNRVPVVATILSHASSPITQDAYRCGNGSVTLTASASSMIYWYDDLVNGNLLDSGLTFTTPVLSQNTVYYAQGGNSCPGIRKAANAFINIQTPDPIAADENRCGNGTITLSANSQTVKWYDAPGGNMLATGNSFTTPSLNQTTTYYITDGNICRSNSVSVLAIIHPVSSEPSVTNTGRCGPGTLLLTASSQENIYWYDAPSGNLLGSGNSFYTPFISNTTTYYAIAGDLCPSSFVEVLAQINAITPDPITNNASRCGPGELVLTAVSTSPIYWYDSPAGSLLSSDNTFHTSYLNTSNTFYVQAGGDCPSNYVAVNATVNYLPTLSLGKDTTLNAGNSILLDAGSGFTSYLWNTQDISQTITVNSSGIYNVIITDANGCQANDSIAVSISTVSTGIANLSQKDFLLYPNPSKGNFKIAIPNNVVARIIKITDVNGKILVNTTLKSGNSELEFSNYSSGIYYLNIIEENSLWTTKVVVE